MIKLLFTSYIILVTQSYVHSQVARATATATIVTPVGAEFFTINTSGNAITKNDDDIKSTGVKLVTDATGDIFLKVISGSFVYNITFQNDMLASGRKTGYETMKIDLGKELQLLKNQQNDIIKIPDTASLALVTSQPAPNLYYSSFCVTVNFN